MRVVVKVYRYECDADGCGAHFEVRHGLTPFPLSKPVESAAEADDAVRANGWHYRGSKAYCPPHAGGRR